ncbi:MAG: hypothetical protein K6C30_06140 [Bacteroidaceae bacterium]|nr:hypothetical protein [Bacteroidaceae bacterium]
MEKSKQTEITIEDLRKFEKYFQVGGMEFGRLQLDKFLIDFYTRNNPLLVAFLHEMQKYDKPQMDDSPASDANMPRQDIPGLNYFAPKMILTRTCQDPAFIAVRSNKKKYTDQWMEECINELMQSEHRDEVASLWAKKNQRLKVKGWTLGAFSDAGIFNVSSLKLARLYYHTETNTAEAKTLAKYMGEKNKPDFCKWISQYVLIH